MTGSENSGVVQLCPECGEKMYIDEDWRLRSGLEVDEPATEGDYVHARCHGDNDSTSRE